MTTPPPLAQFTAEELAANKELRELIFAANKRKTSVRKEKKPNTIPEWVWKRWYDAHVEWFKRTLPLTYADGHYNAVKQEDVTKANGLGWFIVMYMDWMGGDGDKKHVMGRKVDGKWIPTTTKSGQADIQCQHPNGITFHCEIKVGRDTPRDAQLERQEKIRKANGHYEFIHNPMDFFALYDKISKYSVVQTLF